MNSLHTYLECEFATPANTLGAGNPCVDPDGNGLSEPIDTIRDCSGKPSTENTRKRKKRIKDLKEFLQESLTEAHRQK